MEILFENWRRKVEIPSETEPKYSKTNKTNSLMRILRPNNPNNPNIKHTNTTKKFTKDGGGGFSEDCCLNESEMSVVCLPPTPAKPNQDGGQQNGGVSSQILPMHRFSSESSLARAPPVYKEPPRPKPVAEVSPFSTKKVK